MVFAILLRVFESFRKFSQNSEYIVLVVQTRKKLTHCFLNFFEKYAKIMPFKAIFLRIFFLIFENFLKSSYAKIMHFRNFLKKCFKNFRKLPLPRKKSWLRPCSQAIHAQHFRKISKMLPSSFHSLVRFLGSSKLFTTNSEFEVPTGKEYVTVLVVGGGGGAGYGASGGGGAGKVTAGSVKVTPGLKYQVVVGKGGAGSSGTTGVAGSSSSFNNLVANGGTPGKWEDVTVRGGGGSSGGGGGGCSGCSKPNGGSAGSKGADCDSTRQGGSGQGAYDSLFSLFTQSTITAGVGGTYGSGGNSCMSGGGGGGILINEQGLKAADGDRSTGTGYGSQGGVGYGAGGGAGGVEAANKSKAGAAGADGVVYIEWD